MGSLTFLEIPDFFDHIIKALDRHPWASLRSLDPGDLGRRKRDLSQPRGTKETFPQNRSLWLCRSTKHFSTEYVFKGLKGSFCLRGRASSHSRYRNGSPAGL